MSEGSTPASAIAARPDSTARSRSDLWCWILCGVLPIPRTPTRINASPSAVRPGGRGSNGSTLNRSIASPANRPAAPELRVAPVTSTSWAIASPPP